MTPTPRTRFAPSPTGQVHIGNMRVAIFNWLFARRHGGRFLLRIEDTDRERSTEAACETVIRALDWLGLQPDEPPLYQSSRLDAHRAAAERLVERGAAYREDKGGTGRGECIVFRMPGEDIGFTDLVKGDLAKAAADLKDFVIVRSDGHPVFHLANVLDDIEMKITHVIRGDDHVENTFRHIAIYRALGAQPPQFAHLPMIVNAQGKPYSKRDGDAYVGEFRDNGYLPDALLNYLALLGWSPPGDRDVLTRDEMTGLFGFDRVQSSPARFDPVKLDWMNGEHMRRLPEAERLAGYRAALTAAGLTDPGSEEYARRVFTIMEDRIKRFSDTADQTRYFFTGDFPWDEKAVRKRLLKPGVPERLSALKARFAELEGFTADALEQALKELAEERGEAVGAYIHPTRVAVSGCAAGPGLFVLLETLGRERVLHRIERALDRYGGDVPD